MRNNIQIKKLNITGCLKNRTENEKSNRRYKMYRSACTAQCFNSLGRCTYWQEDRRYCIIPDMFCCSLLVPLCEKKVEMLCFNIFHLFRQGVRFFLPDYTTLHSRRTVVIFNAVITLNHLDLSRNLT